MAQGPEIKAMTLLITPIGLDLAMAAAGLIGTLLILFSAYRWIFAPAMKIMASATAPPPAPGSLQEIILRNTRHLRYRIGLVDSEIKLRLKGIVEDHVVLDFKKDRRLEEYEILVIPSGTTFLRHPHSKSLDRMRGRETIESRELIGHPAMIRLVAAMQGERPIHYVEFELSTKYFIDPGGEERMKFLLELKRIHPGIDLKSLTKKGVYNFGRKPGAETPEPTAEP